MTVKTVGQVCGLSHGLFGFGWFWGIRYGDMEEIVRDFQRRG